MAEVKERALTPETKEIIYTAADGQEIRLTLEMVRKYLVQGHGEIVTLPEMVYFLNICRSRKLNPFIRDCYLIKYSQNDPAAIVTSVDFFRKRARAMKDCKGWRSGIIVKDSEGKVKDTAGLIQDGETLLGGWFEAQPEGWTDPLRLEVNLRGYVKKTKEGNLTRFWSLENQPSQIAKVAESQGLRKLWPDEFQGMYSEEEIVPGERGAPIDIMIEEKPDRSTSIKEFDAKTATCGKVLKKYLTVCANYFKKSVDEIKSEAIKDLPGFLTNFEKWAKVQDQKGGKKAETKAAEPGPAFIPATAEEAMAPFPCPDNEQITYTKKHCDNDCPNREGCPAWGMIDAQNS